MGQIIDVGQSATGFIAIGQEATGFFALGQIATGVIAIGQVARGFFVIGQVGFGLTSVGMGSAGLIFSVGMLGVGGRGVGFILPLVPRLRDPRELPNTVTYEELASRREEDGWLDVTVEPEPDQSIVFHADGRPLPMKLDARLRRPLHAAAIGTPHKRMYAFARRIGDSVIVERVMEVPESRIKSSRWWGIWAAQVALLFVTTVVFWYLCARPVLEGLNRVFS
jgi:hypothetical protein